MLFYSFLVFRIVFFLSFKCALWIKKTLKYDVCLSVIYILPGWVKWYASSVNKAKLHKQQQ